jgi:P-type Ca2+ transporter type 2C
MEEILTVHIKNGLSADEVQRSRNNSGSNILTSQKEESALLRLVRQFTSPLVYILLLVGGISFFLREYADSLVVFIVVFGNALIGFFEEGRAKKIISSLQKLTATRCTVRRDGRNIIRPTDDVVVGDLVELYDGDIVPADGVILHATRLQIAEAPITGESYPVEKHALKFAHEAISLSQVLEKVSGERPDDKHLVFRSCNVSSGKGVLLVTAVGDRTVIGSIKSDISRVSGKPKILEVKIKKLTMSILWITALVCVVTLVLGLLRSVDLLHMLEVSVSLGVSVIPEGLPIVVTITLAIGAYRVGRGKALIRNLPSAASLAGISVICTDKTGTLTEGKLAIRNIVPIDGGRIELTDNTHDHKVIEFAAKASEVRMLEDGRMMGDALDIVIHNYYQKIHKSDDSPISEPSDELPFDSRYKFSAKTYLLNSKAITYIKGAPEVLMALSRKRHDESYKRYIDMTAKGGIRTIGVGIKIHGDMQSGRLTYENISDIDIVGFIEFEDPVRHKVRDSIERCEKLGITPIMITGDHIETARFVAQETGIIRSADDGVYEASILDKLSQDELMKIIPNLRVIARATPQDKLKIVELLHKSGKKIAMTGDGVNDAPALAASEIGIAMGKTGTEVAKEASDMILTDDDFSHIVSAIVESRVVIENIRKVLLFLLSTSIAEVICILGALSLGLPIPLLAAQILWLNLVTDGFLNVAMATENKEDIIERRLAKTYHGELLYTFHYVRSFVLGSVMATASLLAYWFVLNNQSNLDMARTIMLIVMVMFQWLNVFNIRTYKSVFSVRPHGNKAVVWALGIQVGLQFVGIYTVFGNLILSTIPVSFMYWIFALSLGASVIVADEVYKIFAREKRII